MDALISLKLDPLVAEDLRSGRQDARESEALREVMARLNTSLQPMHKLRHPDLDQFFIVLIQQANLSQALELLRKTSGVEAAYSKPRPEMPFDL